MIVLVVCSNVCPKKCISFKKDELGVQYPVIDKDICISCHLCEKNCPAKQKLEYKYPKMFILDGVVT